MSNPTPEELEQLRELVSRSRLEDIAFHEISAKIDLEASSVADADEADFDMTVQTRTGDADFGVRVELDLRSPLGGVKVTAAADYALEGEPPRQEVLGRFASEVALMTLFPYLRQAVSDASQRVLGKALLLPMMKRGDISLSPISSTTIR